MYSSGFAEQKNTSNRFVRSGFTYSKVYIGADHLIFPLKASSLATLISSVLTASLLM